MNDEYLWDKSGEPDPEVERLEELLGQLRYEKPLRLPAERRSPRYAAAAVVILAAGTWFLGSRGPKIGWDITRVQGDPRVGRFLMGSAEKLGVGEYLVTNSSTTARLDVARIGTLTVDPGSRVRLVKTGEKEHRVSLQRGVIHAMIWAPPGQFFVDTPSAVAVDLGCKYTLQVDDGGDGLLTVEMGWVAFESKGRESFIPAGAACATKRDSGPGVPYYLDAHDGVLSGLRDGNTAAVLAAARPRDAMTLWHLLARVPQADRQAVYARMAAIAPPPSGVTRDGLLALNQPMMDQYWDSLGLNTAGWWRKWKSEWRQ